MTDNSVFKDIQNKIHQFEYYCYESYLQGAEIRISIKENGTDDSDQRNREAKEDVQIYNQSDALILKRY